MRNNLNGVKMFQGAPRVLRGIRGSHGLLSESALLSFFLPLPSFRIRKTHESSIQMEISTRSRSAGVAKGAGRVRKQARRDASVVPKSVSMARASSRLSRLTYCFFVYLVREL